MKLYKPGFFPKHGTVVFMVAFLSPLYFHDNSVN